MAYRSLPEFNPEARFVANRAFCFNGRRLAVGEPVQGVSERRLRQLFELRKVAPIPDVTPAAERRQSTGAHVAAATKGKK